MKVTNKSKKTEEIARKKYVGQKRKSLSCWVVSEAIAGTRSQCLGVVGALAEIAEREYNTKIHTKIFDVSLHFPWKFLPWPQYFPLSARSFIPPFPVDDRPLPDVFIGAGRKAIAASLYMDRFCKSQKNKGDQNVVKPFRVQLQDPRIPPRYFDLVAAPHHDQLHGDNVIVTDGAPNKIDSNFLAEGKAIFDSLFQTLPNPKIAVLIGGRSKAYKIEDSELVAIAHSLKNLAQNYKAGVMITISRRSPPNAYALFARILAQEIKGGQAYLYNPDNPNEQNPYAGLLAWADYILVSADSVSMISEAASTAKPVYILPLKGGNAKLRRFHDHMMNKGVARLFDGKLDHWVSPGLRDSHLIARDIIKRVF